LGDAKIPARVPCSHAGTESGTESVFPGKKSRKILKFLEEQGGTWKMAKTTGTTVFF
jgi:hypothetical protein